MRPTRGPAGLALPRPIASGWTAAVVAGCIVSAGALTVYPWFSMGIAVGTLLLVSLVIRPLVVIGVLLAIGAADLSFVTGGWRNLLPGIGGLDMNGIRLVGVVVGLSAVLLVDGTMLRHAVARHGRWFLLFLGYAALTIVWSTSPLDGARLLFKLMFPFLVFLTVLAMARSEEQLSRLADWTLVAAAVFALLLNPLLVLAGGYIVDATGRIRLGGLGVGTNVFSFYMLAMLLLAFGRYAVRGQLRYLVLCGVFGVWIALTLTRITFLAGAAGIGGMALFALLRARSYRAFVVAALIGGCAGIFLVPIALERSLGFVPTLPELIAVLRDPAALWESINWQGREVVWVMGFQQILSSPFIGHGLGSSTFFMLTTIPHYGGVVHNEYLRLAMETGMIGVVLFAIALGSWWLATGRAARDPSPVAREFVLPAAGAIIAWAIIAATDNPFDYYSQFTQYVGFFCAGGLAAASFVSHAPEQDDRAALATEAGMASTSVVGASTGETNPRADTEG